MTTHGRSGLGRLLVGSVARTELTVDSVEGVASLSPKKSVTVHVKSDDGAAKTVNAIARVDTPEEVSYYRHGGILQYVLRQML